MILDSAVDASPETLEFQTDDQGLQVHYRIKGIRYDMETIPLHLAEAVLNNLRDLTATGRLLVRVDGKPLDFVVDSDRPTFRFRIDPGIA